MFRANIRCIHYAQFAAAQTFLKRQVEQRKRVGRCFLVAFIITYHPSKKIRRQNLRSAKVSARKRRLARSRGTYEYHHRRTWNVQDLGRVRHVLC